MRLFDRIRAEKLIHPESDMPVIIADDIARQIDELPGPLKTEVSPYTPKDFGRIAPPFPSFFIEATTRALDAPDQVVHRAVLFTDVTEQALSGKLQTNPPDGAPDGTRWVLAQRAFTYFPAIGFVIAPNLVIYTHLNDEGIIMDNLARMPTFAWKDNGTQSNLDTKTQMDIAFAPLPFAHKAIAALHKKGEVVHVEPKRNIRRRLQRKHGVEATDYYILRIKPGAPRVMQEVGEVEPSKSGKKAEHWVRGHFREVEGHPFIPDGLYYIKSHRRGESSAGKIRKDYKIMPED